MTDASSVASSIAPSSHRKTASSIVSGSGATPVCPAPSELLSSSGSTYRRFALSGHDVFVPEVLVFWLADVCCSLQGENAAGGSGGDGGQGMSVLLEQAKPFQGLLFRYKWDEKRAKPFFVDIFDRKQKRWDLPDPPASLESPPTRLVQCQTAETAQRESLHQHQVTEWVHAASLALSTMFLTMKRQSLRESSQSLLHKKIACLEMLEGLTRLNSITLMEDSSRAKLYVLSDESVVLRLNIIPTERAERIEIEDAERCVRLVMGQRLAAMAAENKTISTLKTAKLQRLQELLVELTLQESFARDSVARTEGSAFRAIRSAFLKGAADVATHDALRVRFHEDALAAASAAIAAKRISVHPDEAAPAVTAVLPVGRPALEKELLGIVTARFVEDCLLRRVEEMYKFTTSTVAAYQHFTSVLLGKRLPLNDGEISTPLQPAFSSELNDVGRRLMLLPRDVPNPATATRIVSYSATTPSSATPAGGGSHPELAMVAQRKYAVRNAMCGRDVLQSPCPFACWAQGKLGLVTIPTTIVPPPRMVPFQVMSSPQFVPSATQPQGARGLSQALAAKAASVATAAAAVATASLEPVKQPRKLQFDVPSPIATSTTKRWADDVAEDTAESPRRTLPQPFVHRIPRAAPQPDELVWDVERSKGCHVSADGLECTATVVPRATLPSGRRAESHASGTIGTSSGCFAWAVRVDRTSPGLRIGMSTRFFAGDDTEDPCFLYCSDGTLASSARADMRQSFGPAVENGDKITFVVNFSSGTIAVWMNDVSLGVAFVFQRSVSNAPRSEKEEEKDGSVDDDDRGGDDDLEPLFPVVLFGARGDSVALCSAKFSSHLEA